jgi:hypothetical protein
MPPIQQQLQTLGEWMAALVEVVGPVEVNERFQQRRRQLAAARAQAAQAEQQKTKNQAKRARRAR